MALELFRPKDKPVEDVCIGLKKQHPDWVLLDEDYLRTIDPNNLPENRTFIVPGYLIAKRTHQKKSNVLISYLVITCRKTENSLYFVANDYEELDFRIRTYLEVSIG